MATGLAILEDDNSFLESMSARSEVSDAEARASTRCLEKIELNAIESFATLEDFDCSEIDAQSSITHRLYVNLREAYGISTSVVLLCPLLEARPFF